MSSTKKIAFGPRQGRRKGWMTKTVSPTVILQLATIVVAICVTWSTIFMTCDENLHGGLCESFQRTVSEIGLAITGSQYGAVIVGIFLPIFIATISSYLFHLFCEPKRKIYTKNPAGEVSRWYRFWTMATGGDLPVEFIAFLFIIFPVLWKVFVPLFTFCQGPSNYYHFCDESRSMALSAAIARSTGRASLMAMVWFLIPVSRQSPILVALGLSPIWGLKFHKLAGRVAIICGLVHSIVNIILYAFHKGRSRLDHIFFPKSTCWRYFKPSDFERPLDDPDWDAEDCSLSWFLFTGILAAVFMIFIAFTAFWFIRQRKHRLFYWTHVICGGLTWIFLMMHWGPASLWLGPGIIYYLASTSTQLLQALVTYLRGGVRIASVKLLGNSNFCCELTFPRGKYATREETNYSAQYVRICIPELSLMWHPFTVASTPDQPDKLRILFRRRGVFTSKLYQRVQVTEKPPTVLIDAYYSSADWASHVVRHDKSLLVSGGIGITPFLSVLHKVLKSINEQEMQANLVPREVQLHWSCRDEGLINHVFANHFSHLLLREGIDKDYSSCKEDAPFILEIVVHDTRAPHADELKQCPQSACDDSMESSLDSGKTDIMTETVDDVYIRYDEIRGRDLEIAHFPAKAYNRYIRNIPSILLMATALCVGMWATWRTFIRHTSGYIFIATVPQAYPFYVSAAVAIAAGIVFEFLYQVIAVRWNNYRRRFDKMRSSRLFSSRSSTFSGQFNDLSFVQEEANDERIDSLVRQIRNGGGSCLDKLETGRLDAMLDTDSSNEGSSEALSLEVDREPLENVTFCKEELAGTSTSFSRKIPLDVTVRVSRQASVRFRVVKGRVNVPDAVSVLKDSKMPAFFFCGPEKLYDACRLEIGRQLASGAEKSVACGPIANTVHNTGAKWHVSFYKEEFEL